MAAGAGTVTPRLTAVAELKLLGPSSWYRVYDRDSTAHRRGRIETAHIATSRNVRLTVTPRLTAVAELKHVEREIVEGGGVVTPRLTAVAELKLKKP